MPALTFFILIIFTIVFISLPIFNKLDESLTSEKKKVKTLDGLRGLLAFSVVVNHFDANFHLIKTKFWATEYVFNGLLGSIGVALFFMLTAFLFWGKLLESNGTMNWKILYVNRIFRIAPVYYTVFLIALIIIAFESHFKILGPPSELKNSLLKWLAIGYFECCLDINQFPTMKILGVAWTLRFEWLFYFSLPLTSFFIRKKTALLFCITGLVSGLLFIQITPPIHAALPLFFSGMLCVTLIKKQFYNYNNQVINSSIALVCLFSVFIFFNDAIGILQIMLLSIFFFLVANGATLFGLLSLKGILRLGNISYSLYLLHLVIIYLFFKISVLYELVKQNELTFWLLMVPCTALIIGVSSICYSKIENDGVSFGKKFIYRYLKN